MNSSFLPSPSCSALLAAPLAITDSQLEVAARHRMAATLYCTLQVAARHRVGGRLPTLVARHGGDKLPLLRYKTSGSFMKILLQDWTGQSEHVHVDV